MPRWRPQTRPGYESPCPRRCPRRRRSQIAGRPSGKPAEALARQSQRRRAVRARRRFLRARASIHHQDHRRRPSDDGATGWPALPRRPVSRGQRRNPGDDVSLQLSRRDRRAGSAQRGSGTPLCPSSAVADRLLRPDTGGRCHQPLHVRRRDAGHRVLDGRRRPGGQSRAAGDRLDRDGHPQSSAHPRGCSGSAAAGHHHQVLAGTPPASRARHPHRGGSARRSSPGKPAGRGGHSRIQS